MTEPLEPQEPAPSVAEDLSAPPAGSVLPEPVVDASLADLVAPDEPEPDAAPAAPPPPVPVQPAPSLPAPVQPAAPPAPVIAASPVVAVPVAVTTVAAAKPPRRWPSTLSRIVAFLFGLLQALLILRIVLLLLNANQDNEIVSAILKVTEPFVEPFRGMFQLDEITGAKGSVLDIAAVVALIAWSLIETLILSILRLMGGRRRG